MFASRRPVDLAGMPQRFAERGATAATVGAAAVIRMRLLPGEALGLARDPRGWAASLLPAPAPARPIAPAPGEGRLVLAADGAAEVVTVPDEQTGTLLLVGTTREPGQAETEMRRAPEFVLAATWQGVVVEPLSDALTLRATPGGFLLSAPGPLALSAFGGAGPAGTAMTQALDLPDDAPDALMRLLAAQVREAARAPALARGPARLAAARTLIALGFGAEAGSMLKVAADADPRLADDKRTAALSAVAALLAGRPEEAGGIDDPALDGSDEVAMWRAVRRAVTADPPREDRRAAEVFAATYRVVFGCAPTLRARLAPLLAETMAAAGEGGAARRLVEGAGAGPATALAEAMIDEGRGAAEPALAAYDALADGRDRRMAASAARRAVELRLSSGALDAAGAADALDRRRLGWRGDATEMRGRLRSAELRLQAGQTAAALQSLRETAAQFPDWAEPARRLRDAFAAALRNEAASNADLLEVAAAAEERPELAAAGPGAAILSERLAERLEQLGLDGRAEGVLAGVIGRADADASRPRAALALARLRLRRGDAAGALSALAASPPAGDTEDEARALLTARADARLGRTEAALAALAGLRSAAALDVRAAVLDRAGDGPGALAALSDAAAASAGASGSLDAAGEAAALRLAEAAARSGEAATLGRVRNDYLGRFGAGARADAFRLLTAPPVADASDLSRAAREAEAARTLAGR